MRVAVTGANGEIGRILAPYLAARHEVRLAVWDLPSDRDRGELILTGDAASRAEIQRVDITDAAAVDAFVQGSDAVVHLAAEREVGASWDQLRGPNIDGTANVFGACARHGVRKIVFASSSHVAGGYLEPALATAPDALTADRKPLDSFGPLDGTEPLRPDSLYGVTKAFGEALGRFTADCFGISVVCLRIGWFLAAPHNEASKRMWLSPGDLCRLVSAALDADVKFGIYYGASANTGGLWDLRPAMAELGYQPEDNSAAFAGP
jgi:NAD+ dependent glucose-6-phosphate dehydrogenase